MRNEERMTTPVAYMDYQFDEVSLGYAYGNLEDWLMPRANPPTPTDKHGPETARLLLDEIWESVWRALKPEIFFHPRQE